MSAPVPLRPNFGAALLRTASSNPATTSSTMLRLEQAHRYALENPLHRNKRVGLSAMISETWYNASFLGPMPG
jgi:hypothetical protein